MLYQFEHIKRTGLSYMAQLLDSVYIDQATLPAMLRTAKEAGGKVRRDYEFLLGSTLRDSRIAVKFYDDHSIVIQNILRDEQYKHNVGKSSLDITIRDKQIVRMEYPLLDVSDEYQYSKGGAVHAMHREGSEEKLLTGVAHPALGNHDELIYAATVALHNADDAVRAAFKADDIEQIFVDRKKLMEDSPSVPDDYVLNARVLGTTEWRKREKVDKHGYSDRLKTEQHPLTLMIDSSLGTCLSEMKLTEGAMLLRHKKSTQELAIAFTTPEAMETYMKAAHEHLTSELRDVEASTERAEFSPAEGKLLENARAIHEAKLRDHG